jgi:hypothetical protein
MFESREQWAYRMSFLGLAFASDARQFHPSPGDKNLGGKVHPSRPTTEKNHQLENKKMETTQQSNGTKHEMSDEEARRLVAEFTQQLKRSQTLGTRVINGAVIASGVFVGTSAALTLHHFATKRR